MSERLLSSTPDAWDDYLYWLAHDKTKLRRINSLITDILRGDPFEGVGKPEPLKHALAGYWSRRIDEEHRLDYEALDNSVMIIQARYHF